MSQVLQVTNYVGYYSTASSLISTVSVGFEGAWAIVQENNSVYVWNVESAEWALSSGGSSNNKGYFLTPEALEAAYPIGEAGWYAIVGSTDTIWIWDTDTSAWVNSGTSSLGTVTEVSVATANGLAGSVANPTTTPEITLSTTVTGLLKGDDSAISAAIPGTDYFAPGEDLNLGSNSLITPRINGVNRSLNYSLGAIPSGNEGVYSFLAEANGQEIPIANIAANFADNNPSTTIINPNTLNDEPNSSVQYIFASPNYSIAETKYILNADTSGEAVYSVYDDTQTLREVLRLKADQSAIFSGSLQVSSLTASKLVGTDVNKNFVSVDPSIFGSVTDVSIVAANGFNGEVDNPTTTPSITLKTTITGIIKGDGTALQEAEAGTDYLSPTSTIDGGTF